MKRTDFWWPAQVISTLRPAAAFACFFTSTSVLKDNLHVFPVFSVMFSASLKNDDLKSLLLLLMGKQEKWGENESFLLMITTHMQTTKNNYSWSFLHICTSKEARCLKIIAKVSFNIASEASYVYILSRQKLIKMPKMVNFGKFLKT